LVIAVSPEETREYIAKEDRKVPETEQTVWLLRYFTISQNAQLINVVKNPQQQAIALGDILLLVVRSGLVGVRNFKDGNGVQVPFEQTAMSLLGTKDLRVPSNAFLSRLPSRLIDELSQAILKEEDHRVDEDEAKN
jgi:pyridoxal biosynthesis lyase PdxS